MCGGLWSHVERRERHDPVVGPSFTPIHTHQDLPDHGIFGEEFGIELGKGTWTWVLDPIDGTKSFITGG